MSNRLFAPVLFLLVISISSCKRGLFRPVLEGESATLEINEFDYDYLKAKAKFRYNDGKEDLKATANFRIKKDSLIWMSISASLGIEAARVMINKDSMAIMDRLNKQYTRSN